MEERHIFLELLTIIDDKKLKHKMHNPAYKFMCIKTGHMKLIVFAMAHIYIFRIGIRKHSIVLQKSYEGSLSDFKDLYIKLKSDGYIESIKLRSIFTNVLYHAK